MPRPLARRLDDTPDLRILVLLFSTLGNAVKLLIYSFSSTHPSRELSVKCPRARNTVISDASRLLCFSLIPHPYPSKAALITALFELHIAKSEFHPHEVKFSPFRQLHKRSKDQQRNDFEFSND